jgi:aryl-alcohol dehydrogenase-like predicted oxidoreductase
MKKSTFGRTNLQVTPLGFGAAEVGYLNTDRERVTNILNLLLDSGVNLLDTAASYPGSEEHIGQSVAHRRSEYILVSKCGQAFPDLPGPEWSAQVITATVERALKRLRTDHLDVMLLHSCPLDVLKKGEALGALVQAQNAGKVRFPGYSGDNEAAVYAAGLADVYVLETSISIADQINIDDALPIARSNKVGVLAKRPIANAAWKAPSEQPGFYGNYASTYHDRLKKMNLSPTDLGFPDDRSSWAEIALRFTLSQEGVNTAIIGTTNPENARANIAAADKGPLPKDVVQKIRDAFHKAAGGGKWPGQT